MDNLGSHKRQAIRRLIRTVGAKLFFLPAYSPDLNPIKQVFAKIKTCKADELRRWFAADLERDPIGPIRLKHISISKSQPIRPFRPPHLAGEIYHEELLQELLEAGDHGKRRWPRRSAVSPRRGLGVSMIQCLMTRLVRRHKCERAPRPLMSLPGGHRE
jgi:DDE superfamily endonuclease